MRIDLNCDAADRTLLDLVTAATVPCDGRPRALRELCEAAVKRGVAIGAQVGYRNWPDVDPGELVDDVVYQLGALDAIAGSAGGQVDYVKPRVQDEHATAVVEAIWQYDPNLPVLAQPGSAIFGRAKENRLVTVAEALPDRAYLPDGTPLPDRALHDRDEIAWRCVRLVTHGEIVAVDGTVVPLRADSLYVRRGTSHAVRAALDAAGVEFRSFA